MNPFVLRVSLAALLVLMAAFSCTSPRMSNAGLVPLPQSVIEEEGAFKITPSTQIYLIGDGEGLSELGKYLADLINPATGFYIQVREDTISGAEEGIYLELSDHLDLGEEGYELNVTEKKATLRSSHEAGIFRGIQTIRQLLPVKVETRGGFLTSWRIPAGKIEDWPEYEYRGTMLDVSRHFFSVKDVKRYIDLIALYKINYLHLHLSDDQGWRIEINSWPKLTEIGGSTEVGGGKGGYYTQEDYKEIVRYAQERYITIVPEIDMPGHTNAALASYPELNCSGESPELYTGTEVGFSTLCTDKEVTYQFVDDVIRELVELTPGPYIHIGGDESHVTELEDYIPFIEQVQDIVNSYGKYLIGWDEVAHASLRPESTAQYWAKAENAKMAVDQGAKVLMSPATKAYLDMQYDSTTQLGLHWAAYIEVDSAYLWDPAKLVEGIGKKDILGVEAPLWTETIAKMDELEYMVFPRLLGIAEIGWTAPSRREWEDYKKRLIKQGKRLEALEVNYYKSKRIK